MTDGSKLVDMATHDLECDMGEDCTCPAGELETVFLQMGMYVVAVPTWAYETMLSLGIDPPLAQIMGPPEHPELGPLEI